MRGDNSKKSVIDIVPGDWLRLRWISIRRRTQMAMSIQEMMSCTRDRRLPYRVHNSKMTPSLAGAAGKQQSRQHESPISLHLL